MTTTPVRRCLNVGMLPFNHLLMVRAESTEPVTEVHTSQIDAVIMHVFKHEIVREGAIFFAKVETLYFAQAALYPGWCYILKWYEKAGRYGCSCVENRLQSYCEHQRMLEDLTGRL